MMNLCSPYLDNKHMDCFNLVGTIRKLGNVGGLRPPDLKKGGSSIEKN